MEKLIKINDVEKTEVEWFEEFEALGTKKFFETYNILNRGALIREIRNQTSSDKI